MNGISIGPCEPSSASYIEQGCSCCGGSDATIPQFLAPTVFHTYTKVVAYGSGDVRDPVKAAQAPHILICVNTPVAHIFETGTPGGNMSGLSCGLRECQNTHEMKVVTYTMCFIQSLSSLLSFLIHPYILPF